MPATSVTVVAAAAVKKEALFHKMMGDPVRLKMALRLLVGDANVGDLAEAAGLSQSRASQILARMKEAGLLDSRREGNYIFYFIHSDWQPAIQEIGARCEEGGTNDAHQDRGGKTRKT